MKKTTLVLLAIICLGCSPAPRLDWLHGDWKRINNEDGQTFESWSVIDNENANGEGYTIENGARTFSEKMTIEKIENSLYLKVIQSGETSSTNFQFTHHRDSYFETENLDNEYPKHVTYKQVSKDTLLATISNFGQEKIEFWFVRK